jgi:hypothetical protein
MFSPRATSGFSWKSPRALRIIASAFDVGVTDLVPETIAVEMSGLKEGILSLMVASVAQPVRATARTPTIVVANGLIKLIFTEGALG